MQKGFESSATVVTTTPKTSVESVSIPTSTSSASNASTDLLPVLSDTINSPMVGTFYASPSPEASVFVKVGDNVKKGQTLCILEAMKIMNEVEAEFDCKIVKILVEDGNPVEYDMPIFVVEKL